MSNIGWFYRDGLGVKKDLLTAMDWFIEAYLSGFEEAKDYINGMLEDGFAVKKYYERYGELMFAGVE